MRAKAWAPISGLPNQVTDLPPRFDWFPARPENGQKKQGHPQRHFAKTPPAGPGLAVQFAQAKTQTRQLRPDLFPVLGYLEEKPRSDSIPAGTKESMKQLKNLQVVLRHACASLWKHALHPAGSIHAWAKNRPAPVGICKPNGHRSLPNQIISALPEYAPPRNLHSFLPGCIHSSPAGSRGFLPLLFAT